MNKNNDIQTCIKEIEFLENLLQDIQVCKQHIVGLKECIVDCIEHNDNNMLRQAKKQLLTKEKTLNKLMFNYIEHKNKRG
jgi:hypothetical protein